MAATSREIDDAYNDAKLEILKAIPGSNAATALKLAEAYAWLTSPNQPHGASSNG